MRALSKLKQENLLFFDIETASVVGELQLDTPLFDSWSYKVNRDGKTMNNCDIIKTYSEESGLYPEFAKVVSIVVGKIVEDEIVLVTFDDPDEVTLLNKFNRLVERNIKDKLCGFVNIGFDTPFVFKRMVINGIIPNEKLDSSGLKPWEVDEIDLAVIWKGTSFARASLINIATAFGLPSPKDDISGADVGRVYWAEGAEGLKRISAYCRKDVATTINIFRSMRHEVPLELADSESIEAVEAVPETLINELFNGAKYGVKEKNKLLTHLKSLEDKEREKSLTLLDCIVSAAKGKKTKITKAHVRALKKQLEPCTKI